MDTGAIVGIITAIIGCVVGLAGWLTSRDKKTIGDAEWRGSVNGKLDSILGIQNNVERLEKEQKAQGERLAKVEASAAQAHRRIDTVEGRVNKHHDQ